MSTPGPARRGVDGIYLPAALAARAVKRKLNDWRQGDLVRGTPLFWAAPLDDELTGLCVDDPGDGALPVVRWDGTAAVGGDEPTIAEGTHASDTPLWSIITSQTCDVAATGPGQRHPTVQVSPLRELSAEFNPGRVTEIRRGSNVDLVYVPNVPTPGEWAADLRISLPISKAVLLIEERVHGFRDAREAIEFGERVAAKTRRPALHDEIADGLVNGLRELVGDARDAGDTWPDRIEQFRLLVTDGDRLYPKNVAVLAITVVPADLVGPGEREPLRQWQSRERRRLARASDGIVLGPVRWHSVDEMSVRDYRDSDPLRVPELGGPAFW